jgi:site-specific recombinase XerD
MPLKLYRRNGVYHYRGTVGPAGKRRRLRGSCKTKDQDIAARQIAELEAHYWKGHFDGPEAVLTFALAAKMYRAAGKSTTFLEPIENYLKQTLVKDITEGAIQVMAKELYPHVSNASLNRMVIVPTLAVINHAARSKLCARMTMPHYEEDSKVKDPATLEWVTAFRAHAKPHLGAMVLFMYLTGARPGEAVGVQWEDLDLQAATVLIRESKVSKERVAHLPPALVVALANLPRIEGRGVFVYTASNTMRKAWETACKKAGIKILTPHCCRHGFATGLLRRGVDVVTVAWLGGWASAAQVLKTYGHAIKNPKLTDLLTGPELALYADTQETRGSWNGDENQTSAIA